MTKAILLVVAILFFRMMLPRRQRRSSTSITPYQSVFDVEVPVDLACAAVRSSGLGKGSESVALLWQGAFEGTAKAFTTEDTEGTE